MEGFSGCPSWCVAGWGLCLQRILGQAEVKVVAFFCVYCCRRGIGAHRSKGISGVLGGSSGCFGYSIKRSMSKKLCTLRSNLNLCRSRSIAHVRCGYTCLSSYFCNNMSTRHTKPQSQIIYSQTLENKSFTPKRLKTNHRFRLQTHPRACSASCLYACS